MNLERLMKTLGDILSEKHGVRVTVTLKNDVRCKNEDDQQADAGRAD